MRVPILEEAVRGGSEGPVFDSAVASSPSSQSLALPPHGPIAPDMASRNHRVMVVGCVIAVPTQTANAPCSKAVAACPGVWMRPSTMIGSEHRDTI